MTNDWNSIAVDLSAIIVLLAIYVWVVGIQKTKKPYKFLIYKNTNSSRKLLAFQYFVILLLTVYFIKFLVKLTYLIVC